RVVSHDALLAEQQLLRAETELATADAQRARTSELIARGALSKAELERVDNAVARAREEHARAKLTLADARGGAEQKVASASVLEARSRRDAAKARLDQHRVTAPAKGVVLERYVEAGDIVDGSRVSMLFALDGPTRLTVDPDERALGVLRVGQLARASTEAFPEQSFDARVEWIAPAVDESRGTVEVRLLVERPPEYVRPDMTVAVTISAGQRDRALVLPRELVRDPSSDPWVAVLKDGRETRVPVKLGLRSTRDVEIVDGLAEGDLVVPLAGGRPAVN
ncbi:efflux RND transporter periplasmic adaptor subunit, partial [Myxococcota bacterium]|nr:efflux RND transporter periplasmic adaptor subunit [Myxococcota bacterium]